MFDFPETIGKRIGLGAAVAFFLLAGLNHFINPDFYLAMMPPYLPAHRLLVNASGVLEMAGGLGLIFAATRKPAGYGLIALLVAIFPANIYMAVNPEHFAPPASAWLLYLRLPLQFAFMGWVYWLSR